MIFTSLSPERERVTCKLKNMNKGQNGMGKEMTAETFFEIFASVGLFPISNFSIVAEMHKGPAEM